MHHASISVNKCVPHSTIVASAASKLTSMLLHSSSPFSLSCTTPSHSSYYSTRSHKPANSSPLASPSYSSPTHNAERRRAQHKSTTASHRLPALQTSAKLLFRPSIQTPADPQKVFLRERLQARCRQHAQKLRERAVSSRRSSDKCSDVFMDCDDEDESDDIIMQDEVRLCIGAPCVPLIKYNANAALPQNHSEYKQ